MFRSVLILLCLSCLLCNSSAHAAKNEQVLKIPVKAAFEPSSALGMLLSEDSNFQAADTKIEKHSSGSYVVSFSVPKQEIKQGALATVLLLSESGEVALGDLVSLEQNALDPAIIALADCAEPEVSIEAVRAQFATLDSLVNLRVRQRDLLKDSISSELSGDLLAKLSQLERGFGLKLTEDLSSDLQPYELFERLSRLKTAIANHRANAERRAKSSPN